MEGIGRCEEDGADAAAGSAVGAGDGASANSEAGAGALTAPGGEAFLDGSAAASEACAPGSEACTPGSEAGAPGSDARVDAVGLSEPGGPTALGFTASPAADGVIAGEFATSRALVAAVAARLAAVSAARIASAAADCAAAVAAAAAPAGDLGDAGVRGEPPRSSNCCHSGGGGRGTGAACGASPDPRALLLNDNVRLNPCCGGTCKVLGGARPPKLIGLNGEREPKLNDLRTTGATKGLLCEEFNSASELRELTN